MYLFPGNVTLSTMYTNTHVCYTLNYTGFFFKVNHKRFFRGYLQNVNVGNDLIIKGHKYATYGETVFRLIISIYSDFH